MSGKIRKLAENADFEYIYFMTAVKVLFFFVIIPGSYYLFTWNVAHGFGPLIFTFHSSLNEIGCVHFEKFRIL